LFLPLCDALEVPVTPPDRPPVISRCRNGKIHRTLGYRPRHDFHGTVDELEQFAWEFRHPAEPST
jgi:hypothetical protein